MKTSTAVSTENSVYCLLWLYFWATLALAYRGMAKRYGTKGTRGEAIRLAGIYVASFRGQLLMVYRWPFVFANLTWALYSSIGRSRDFWLAANAAIRTLSAAETRKRWRWVLSVEADFLAVMVNEDAQVRVSLWQQRYRYVEVGYCTYLLLSIRLNSYVMQTFAYL